MLLSTFECHRGLVDWIKMVTKIYVDIKNKDVDGDAINQWDPAFIGYDPADHNRSGLLDLAREDDTQPMSNSSVSDAIRMGRCTVYTTQKR